MDSQDLQKISQDIKDSIDSRTESIQAISEAVESYIDESLIESEQVLESVLDIANNKISNSYNTLCNAKEILYNLNDKKRKELSIFYSALETFNYLVFLKFNLFKFLGLSILSIMLFYQIVNMLDTEKDFIKYQCNVNPNTSICLNK